MRNITTPTKAVSFEDALRNLAARLTGTPAASLPRTQEGVVQYMAERIPSVDDLAEAVTREVLARISDPAEEAQADEEVVEELQATEEAVEEPKAAKGRKRKPSTD